ncbi:MAG: nucleoside monophosphate kinase [Cyanobacteria bacterium P01_E01_bin.42]
MRLVMLGGPGSGKGTQLRRLSQTLNMPGISVGEILRDAIAKNTFIGVKAKSYVENGDLVPDEIMIQFMRLRLLQDDVSKGWLLEGYPRTAFQAEELEFLLEDFKQDLDGAIYLKLDPEVSLERSLARGRPDDTREILQRRIKEFQERTTPILEYYARRGRLLTIDGKNTPSEVEAAILRQLK